MSSDDGWGDTTVPPMPFNSVNGGQQNGFGGGNGDVSAKVAPSSGFNSGFGAQPVVNKNTGIASNSGSGDAGSGFSSVNQGARNENKSSFFGGGSNFGGNASNDTKTTGSGGGFETLKDNKGFAEGSNINGKEVKPAGSVFGSSNGFGNVAVETAHTKSSFGGANVGISGFGNLSVNRDAPSSENKGVNNTTSGGLGFGTPGKTGGSGFGSFGSSGVSRGLGNSSTGFGTFSGGNCSDETAQQQKSRGACHNCGEEGHISRDCALPKKPRDGFSGFGNSGGSGLGSGGGGFGSFGGGDASAEGDRSKGCFNCGEQGHRSADCAQPRKNNNCYNCGQDGHRSSECTEPRKERAPVSCYNCGHEGHRCGDCPEPQRPREDGSKPPSTFIPPDDETEALYHAGVEKGSMFERFFEAAVTTTCGGIEEKKDVLNPFERFDQLKLGDKILQNIIHSGYSKPTPVQQHAMPVILAGHDVLACAQTGTGKTAAFLLPIMSKLLENSDMNTAADDGCFPRCLIIAPTRELAVQIYNESRKFANGTVIECAVTYGGTHVGHQRGVLAKGATILVGTAGRLNQFIQENTVKLDKLRFLVMDEADRMLELGLQDAIQNIATYESMPDRSVRQTLMFSATFPTAVQVAARELLKNDYTMLAIDEIGAANKCITQELIKCDKSEKKDKLMELLTIDKDRYTIDKNSELFAKKTLIFVSKKGYADTLGAIVSSSGLPSTTIHGDRLQNERYEAMRDFIHGRKAVMIATAVAERGLDIKGVDHVINYDLPEEIDQYVHRIGRTGRVGNSGRATSFYVPAFDQKLAPGLLKCMTDAEQVVPEWLKAEADGAGDVPSTASTGFGAPPQALFAQAEEEW